MVLPRRAQRVGGIPEGGYDLIAESDHNRDHNDTNHNTDDDTVLRERLALFCPADKIPGSQACLLV